jgi:hypothetical protein
MRTILVISYIFITLLTHNLIAQNNSNLKLKQPKYKRVSEAYSYLMAQEATLKRIENEYPQLGIQVRVAQISFNQTFGISKKGIENYLTNTLGGDNYLDYLKTIQSQIETTLLQQQLTLENATLIIEEVKNRAKGDISNSTVLETLLSFQYENRPQDEYLQGFTHTFSTENHPKGRNSNCSIRVPISWRASEANRPHIVQKFISDYGDGPQSIMLLIYDMPLEDGISLSNNELNKTFSDAGIVSLLPENATLISFSKINLDGLKGGMIEYEMITNSLDKEVKIRMIQYYTIYENIKYSVECSLLSGNPDADLTIEMQKYKSLYKLVANSLVLNNRYK